MYKLEAQLNTIPATTAGKWVTIESGKYQQPLIDKAKALSLSQFNKCLLDNTVYRVSQA